MILGSCTLHPFRKVQGSHQSKRRNEPILRFFAVVAASAVIIGSQPTLNVSLVAYQRSAGRKRIANNPALGICLIERSPKQRQLAVDCGNRPCDLHLWPLCSLLSL